MSKPRAQKAAGLAAALQTARAEDDCEEEAQRCPARPGKRRSSSEAVALAKKQKLEATAVVKEQAKAVRAALADEARQQKAQAKVQAKAQATAAAAAAKESATRERLLAKLVKGAVAALLRRVRVDANARARAFEVWRARLELWLPARARAPVRCAGRRLDAQAQADGQGRAPAARGGAHCAKADREAPACGGAGGRACSAGPEGEARHGHTEARNADHGARARGESGARSFIFERDVCSAAGRRGGFSRFPHATDRARPTPHRTGGDTRPSAVRPADRAQ